MKKLVPIWIFATISFVLNTSLVPVKKVKYSSDNNLIGIWLPVESNGEFYFKKSKQFKTDEFGIEFKKDGKLVVRRLPYGVCGNCLLNNAYEYEFHESTWERVNDSTIKTPGNFWGKWFQEEIILSKKSHNSMTIDYLPKYFYILGQEFILKD